MIAAQPYLLTRYINRKSTPNSTFRPLEAKDVQWLCEFLESLSNRTRLVWRRDHYDLAEAKRLCDAIWRYDKLRMIIEDADNGKIQGLFEFSFDIPDSDRERFARHGIELNALTDCRFAACLRDECQGTGLGSLVIPAIKEVSGLFGRSRIILWGGVVEDNAQAIRFYRKHGFQTVGRFLDAEGQGNLDMLACLPDIE